MRSNNEENLQVMKIDYPLNSKRITLESSKLNESHETGVVLGDLNGKTLVLRMGKIMHDDDQ